MPNSLKNRAKKDSPINYHWGYSEYHTGLALNLKVYGADKKTYTLDDAKYSEIAQWLYENAADYGFVLRYPEGKEDITGVEYEDLPGHFRYVGVPAATAMQEEGLCLEEFIEFIKEYTKNDAYSVTVGEVEYEIYFVEGEDVPDVDAYDISGNNVDGFIVTVRK